MTDIISIIVKSLSNSFVDKQSFGLVLRRTKAVKVK